ncbi:muscle-specific protein 300 kDa-like [Uranotaenia lowii]|uniref:muscle-specific protein 300 kDa-like n=1 Tax=Uranotaenia lowii TaxID=190385 RepID=UPI002479B035|nr:muscle-specific protein 300 kDa-like [Uranotaenia lowii]
MSGPPTGGGRGWLRTPPPTYFRSPSPWIPHGSTPPLTQIASTSFQNTGGRLEEIAAQPQIDRSTAFEYGSSSNEIKFQRTDVQTSSGAIQKDIQYQKPQGMRPLDSQFYQTSIVQTSSKQHPTYQPPVSRSPMSSAQQVYSEGLTNSPVFQRSHPPSTASTFRQSPYPCYQHGDGSAPMMSSIGEYSAKQVPYVVYDYSGEYGPSTAEIIANQSQDYVDEKLAEYQATIHLLQDEQERVQKKTFVNWINSFLCKRNPPLKIQDLINDLKDGTKLLALLEVLSGERLPMEKGKVLRRPHYLSNVNTALQFLTSKRIKLVNINPSDIVDGRPAVVLGLIWTIILYFQIEENSRILHYLNDNLSGSVSSLDSGSTSHIPSPCKPLYQGSAVYPANDMLKQGPKKTLLGWVNNALPKHLGLEVRDFGASWRDGLAFLSLIDAIKTNVINLAEMKRYNNRYRLDTAFNVAESELGIARLLDAEDVDVESPDEKSVMTYVAQFLHKYPDVKNINSKTESQQELYSFLEWLRNVIRYYDSLNGIYVKDYNLYSKALDERTEKLNSYKKIKNIYGSKAIPEVQELNNLWPRLEKHLHQWLWYLDCSLPDQFGVIGSWLSNGEKMLNDDDIPDSMNEETASLISKRLEAHKQFFAAYFEVLETFNQLKLLPIAAKIPEVQLINLEKRLIEIEPKARQRRIKLKFLEHKCCLIAFLNLLENKINAVRYNNFDTVKQSLEQLKNFVTRNQIMQEFEKALLDMRQVIEEYKMDGNISKKDAYNIDAFLRDIEDRWKNVSSRLICTETMLEDVLSHWKRWKELKSTLESWINSAYQALKSAEDDKMDFFQNLGSFKDKYNMLAETYKILKSTCDYETAVIIEKQFEQIMQNWEHIFQHTKQYLHVGDILQHRQKFKADTAQLSEWIQKSESILARNNLKKSDQIRECEAEVKQIAYEFESMEELFKSISKSFQALIKEYSREEVDRMMNLMKQEKEALVRIRAQISLKLHLFHQLLTQQEALESGQREITTWLDEAENLLISYAFNNDSQLTKANLVKHKTFFNRTLYYKSMLESKNNVFHSILKLTNSDNSIDVSEASFKMKQLNERFTYVINNANDWEYKLQENLKAWERFEDAFQKAEQFNRQASAWQNANLPIEKQSDVETQLQFFNNADQSLMPNLEVSTEELLKYLPPNEQRILIDKIEGSQKLWGEVISKIPQHLLMLEFRMNEISFLNYISELEKELNGEEQALNCNENFEAILIRHNNFFQKADLQKTEKILASLEKTNIVFMETFENDSRLLTAYQKANDTWVLMCKRIENVKNILHRIPSQWNSYHQKFDEMLFWMDQVDVSLKQIVVEKETIEQFEQEKISFQLREIMKICFEADAKREDMKWLVKTLDFLLSHANEVQASLEQDKIEKLIARYKTLIPTIETTMISTEVFSKCYTFRKESEEICSLLDRIRTQSNDIPNPDSYQKVNEMIEEQNYSIKELDNQRTHIMKMLQKGKDLSKNLNAPDFVNVEVKKLEDSWNATYNNAVEKLKSLKGIQKVWNDYNEQKVQIISLLNSAEVELRSETPLQSDPKSVVQDLEAKKQLVLNLRQASSKSLLQLNDLCRELGMSINPNSRQAIAKESQELEKRVRNTVDFVEKRVEYLEDYNDKWKDYKERLDNLKNWANNVFPKMVAAIKQPHITPEQRVAKTKQLETILSEKMRMLDVLNASTTDLASKEGNLGEMKRLKKEVSNLLGTFSEMSQLMSAEKSSVNKDLDTWQSYSQDIEYLQTWASNASLASELQPTKLKSLTDAREKEEQLKNFNNECRSKMNELRSVEQKTNSIKYGMRPTDEIDKCHMALATVAENAEHLKGKLNKLVTNWSTLENDLDKINQYVKQADAKLQNFNTANINHLPIDKLEEAIKSLKIFNNEISEQQAKVISLIHLFDQINGNISDDGIRTIKQSIGYPEERLTCISERVRSMISEHYQNILVQQQFNTKLIQFSNWMDQIRSSLSELETMTSNDVDLALQNVSYLMDQHANKQDLFNDIYSQIKQNSVSAQPSSNAILEETYTSLASNYQNLENDLHKLKNYLQKWSEFLHWYNNTKELAKHCKDSIHKYDLIGEDELAAADKKIADIKESIAEWKSTMMALEHSPCVRILNEQRNPINAVEMIIDLENKLNITNSQIQAKLKEICFTKERALTFRNAHQQALDNLKNISVEYNNTLKNVSLENLEEVIEKLSTLHDNLNQQLLDKAEIQCEGNLLMKQEIVSIDNLHEPLQRLDKEIDNVQQQVDESLVCLREVQNAYSEFNRCNKELDNDLKNISQINSGTILNFTDKPSLVQQLDQLKNASEIVRKIRKNIDFVANKGNEIIKNFRTYNSRDCDVILEILRQNNVCLKSNLDTLINHSNELDQKYELYAQLETINSDIIAWIEGMRDRLNRVQSNPSDMERKISMYKSELPTQMVSKENFNTIMSEMKQSNNDFLPDDISVMNSNLVEALAGIENFVVSLNDKVTEYATEERNLKDQMKIIIGKLYQLREEIMNCDDVALDSSKQILKLDILKQLRGKLNILGAEITELKNQFVNVEPQFDSLKESTIAKEIQNLEQRFGITMNSLNETESKLHKLVEKSFKEKLQGIKRLISSQVEKLKWCHPESGSDMYNLEMKKATIGDIKTNMCQCENSLQESNSMLKSLSNILPKTKVEHLNEDQNDIVNELQFLQDSCIKTDDELNSNISLWKRYEDISAEIIEWLKEMEQKHKMETILLVDLSSVNEKISEIKNTRNLMSEYEPKLHQLLEIAEKINHVNSESRVMPLCNMCS